MLFTPCSHPVHKPVQPASSFNQNLIGKVSSPVLQVSSEQTIGRRTTCKRLGHHGRIRAQSPIPKMESENWPGCFGKGECRCRGRSLLPCCAGCFEPLSGKASSDLSSGALIASDRCSGQARKTSGVQSGRCVGPDSVDQWPGDNGSGGGRVACIVRLLRLVAPPLPVTFSVTV